MPHPPVTVVLTTGQDAAETRACLDSLRPSLGPRDQVVVVGPALAMTGLAGLRQVPVPGQQPLAERRSAGLTVTETELVVLVDADTLAPRHALDALLAPLEDPAVSAVGPISDLGLGRQQVTAAPPALVGSRELREFSTSWRERHRGEQWDEPALGDAVLAARAADLAGLDLGPELGTRLAALGRLAVAGELFWHHRGSDDCGLLEGPPIGLSAFYIVKDEERLLPGSLESVAGLVDEIVVYDTGSSDRTVEIARAAGARVVLGYWDDHFADAKNRSLAHCRGRWVLNLDADERVDVDRAYLAAALATPEAEAYGLRLENQSSGGGPTGEGAPLLRLFRRSQLVFASRIHEQPVHRTGRLVITPGLEGFRIIHLGYAHHIVRERDKGARNQRLAELALQDVGTSGTAGEQAMNAARSCHLAGNHPGCLEHAERAFATQGATPLARRLSCIVAFRSALSLGRLEMAREWLARLREISTRQAQADLFEAELLVAEDRPAEALELFDRVPDISRDDLDWTTSKWESFTSEARALLALGRTDRLAERLLAATRAGSVSLDLPVVWQRCQQAGRSLEELADAMAVQCPRALLAQVGDLPVQTADLLLELLWARRPGELTILAAVGRVTGLSVLRALEWSARFRERGLVEQCPLLAVAGDPSRTSRDQVLAAAVAIQAFADQRALQPFLAAASAIPDAEGEAVVAELRLLAPQVVAELLDV